LDDGVPGVPPGITGVEGVAATHTKTKSSLFIINISTSTYVYCISMKYIMVDESFSFFPPLLLLLLLLLLPPLSALF
jgi:hypothetical protein